MLEKIKRNTQNKASKGEHLKRLPTFIVEKLKIWYNEEEFLLEKR